jgi:hypothetical protein
MYGSKQRFKSDPNKSSLKIPSIGVALHRALTLNIFKRVTANPTNCCGFYRVSLSSPQQLVELAVILLKIFKVFTLCKLGKVN